MRRKTTAALQTYGSREQLLQRLSPAAQFYAADNPQAAHFGKAPTLEVMRAAWGDNMPVMWLLPQLYDLCEYTAVKKLDIEQATQLAGIIARRYSHFKASELLLFFYRFKAGYYGRFYGTVDTMVIMEALDRFAGERTAAIIEHRKTEDCQDDEQTRALLAQLDSRARRLAQQARAHINALLQILDAVHLALIVWPQLIQLSKMGPDSWSR